MDFKNAKVPKMPGFRIGGGLITAGLLGSVGLYAALNSLYNVEGGHRAIVFNRIGGITNKLYSEVDVKLVFKEVSSKFLRRRIVEGGKRSDGRIPSGIRSINSQCGLLPRAHGSALFTRGETQALAVATLEDKQMAQRVDNLVDVDEFKRFYLQYTFPPSCVGEAGRVGAHSRREIGHGMLAERSLEPVLPSEDDFPYTIRVESTITESNGSSSVARCWSSFAGIAMGLVLDTKEFGGDGTPLILSDITGGEDASGDMDFKVAGNENGVTAFQMDIKVAGITLSIMKQALLQAREGRKVILGEMSKCSPPPSKGLSKYAPLILVMKVLVDAECTHDGSIKHIRKFEKWGWDTLQQRVLDAQRNDMLTNLQLQLLANGFRLLKAGGSLVYSTCSLTVAQNEDVVEQFLSQNPCAKLKAIDGANIWPCKSGSISKTLRFDPSTSQTSGLFIAKFTKSAA